MTRGIAHITEVQRDRLRERLLQRARVLGEAEVGVSSVQRDADELREVCDAIARLDEGTYGVCVDCGSALPFVRLDAMPQARRCMHCQSEHERTRASPASL